MFYFDSAGSFPLLTSAKEALVRELERSSANPSSDHECGLNAARNIEIVREELATSIGAYPSEIIFTSGATESNNLAIKSVISKISDGKKHIITSKTEHKCVLSICNSLASLGFDITYITPDVNGLITPEVIDKNIREDTALVSIMHVNNELGSQNPISAIGDICVENGILLHTDAAQSFGKLPTDVDDLNVDFMSLSSHKIGGIKGVGALYIRDAREKNIIPVIHGAGQEIGLRGGTLPTPLILSFGAAIREFPVLFEKSEMPSLKSYMLEQLASNNIEFRVNGANQVPNIISLTLPGLDVTSFIQATRHLFCLSQGSACSSREIEPSHVLTSIGMDRNEAERTIRLSFDFNTNRASIDALVHAIAEFRE